MSSFQPVGTSKQNTWHGLRPLTHCALATSLTVATTRASPSVKQNESLANLRRDPLIRFQNKPADRLASITGRTRVRTVKLQPVFDAAFHAADPDERRAWGLHSLAEVATSGGVGRPNHDA
jgi:hypothetical protein